MNSDSLKYVLREFADRPLPQSRPRELSLPTDSGKVIRLSGVRRCGKVFLFFDTIRRLLEPARIEAALRHEEKSLVAAGPREHSLPHGTTPATDSGAPHRGR